MTIEEADAGSFVRRFDEQRESLLTGGVKKIFALSGKENLCLPGSSGGRANHGIVEIKPLVQRFAS